MDFAVQIRFRGAVGPPSLLTYNGAVGPSTLTYSSAVDPPPPLTYSGAVGLQVSRAPATSRALTLHHGGALQLVALMAIVVEAVV